MSRVLPAARLIVGVVLVAVMVGACNKPSGGSSAGANAGQGGKTTYIADVPVPSDFVLDEQKSMHRDFPNARVVAHVYYGPGTAQGARNFFVTQMKENQWHATAETLNEGEYILRYMKGSEICDIRIKHGGTGSLFKPILVRVNIEPQQESGGAPRSN